MNSEFLRAYLAGDFSRLNELVKLGSADDIEGVLSVVSSARVELSLARLEAMATRVAGCLERAQASLHQMLISVELEKIRAHSSKRLELYGFSAGSQNGEDGIVSEIFRRIGVTNRIFLEIGVGAGTQNNTVYLLKSGWSGFWVEGNAQKAEYINTAFSDYISLHLLVLSHSFVNQENASRVLNEIRVPSDFDFLSIDIDGNDYYVVDALGEYRPRVIAVEYNGLYRPPVDVVQRYDSNYSYDPSTYVGASLSAWCRLLESKGYQLVATDIVGINAFFVRDDCLGDFFVDVGNQCELYNPPRTQLAWGGAFGFGAGINAAVAVVS